MGRSGYLKKMGAESSGMVGTSLCVSVLFLDARSMSIQPMSVNLLLFVWVGFHFSSIFYRGTIRVVSVQPHNLNLEGTHGEFVVGIIMLCGLGQWGKQNTSSTTSKRGRNPS